MKILNTEGVLRKLLGVLGLLTRNSRGSSHMFTVSWELRPSHFGKLKLVTFFQPTSICISWDGVEVGECLFKQICVSSVRICSHWSHQESWERGVDVLRGVQPFGLHWAAGATPGALGEVDDSAPWSLIQVALDVLIVGVHYRGAVLMNLPKHGSLSHVCGKVIYPGILQVKIPVLGVVILLLVI